jgi:hypothetical protein
MNYRISGAVYVGIAPARLFANKNIADNQNASASIPSAVYL